MESVKDPEAVPLRMVWRVLRRWAEVKEIYEILE
jgi:hypothetical protein